jgi:hypothetical protein
MDHEYGVPSTETISGWITLLHVQMLHDANVRDLVSVHRVLHSDLNMARGYVINEDDAVRALIQATKSSSFRINVIQLLTEHRGVANQTFYNLAGYLCRIETVTQAIAAPTAGQMYAMETILPAVVPQVNAVSATVVTNADILEAIQSLVLSSNKPQKSKLKSILTVPAPIEYCWTHGVCGHTGASCKRPAVGHITTATAANPAGGNTSKWLRPD